jgi:hypothetical protein
MKNTNTKINEQKNKVKIDKNDVLMVTGCLTEAALLQSMTQSKTLTIMVIVLLAFFGVLLWFLFGMT